MNAEQTLAQHADTAHEQVRRIAALTVFEPALPAPDLYPVLGSLAQLGHALEQACRQLAAGLLQSPDYYDLYEADGGSPAETIEEACGWLDSAAQHAGNLGYALSKAHNAIAGQGWHNNAGDGDDQADDHDDELNGASR